MTVIGIDGCRTGWCVATFEHDQLQVGLYRTLDEIIKDSDRPSAILIDTPIGLGDKTLTRDVDIFARDVLKPIRHQSIFMPPVREALQAGSYEAAKAINQSITGKMISIQSWNIAQKIKDADSFLLRRPEYKSIVHEAHPEICFTYLNQGRIPVNRKNATNGCGIEERLNILLKYQENIRSVFEKATTAFKASQVKKDDIIDALCLAITAKYGLFYGFEKITGSNKMDAQAIEMSIYYFNPTKH